MASRDQSPTHNAAVLKGSATFERILGVDYGEPTPGREDVLKTVGDIRAAAYVLWDRAGQTTLAAQVHDSICFALPDDSETSVSISRSADELLASLHKLLGAMEMQEGREVGEMHITQKAMAVYWADAKGHARAAIAKALGTPAPGVARTTSQGTPATDEK